MESQDLVTFKPELIKMLDTKMFSTFNDENLTEVLSFLRVASSMTIPDLVLAFKKEGIEKSESTVYRYIQKLIDRDLVTKSGKRISSATPEEIRSETLYSRTARVFVNRSSILNLDDENLAGEQCNMCNLSAQLLLQLFPKSNLSAKCFSEVIGKIEHSRIKLFTQLVENADQVVLDQFDDISFEQVKEIINLTGWIAAIKTIDLDDEIAKCTKSKK